MSYRIRSGLLNDICLPVTVTYETESFQINKAWIGGAFALGLAFGILVTIFCVPVCIRDYFKKRQQDQEEIEEDRRKERTRGETVKIIDDYDDDDTVTIVSDGKGRKKSAGKKKGKGKGLMGKLGLDDEYQHEKKGKEVKIDKSFQTGMGGILVKFTSEEAESEIAKQDLDRVDHLSNDLGKEKESMFLAMLRMKLKKAKIDDPLLSRLVNFVMEDIQNKKKMIEDDKLETEAELRVVHSKDQQTLDNELEKIDMASQQKENKILDEEREKIKQDLRRHTKLSEAEIEAVMEGLLKDMGKLEKKLNDERLRQQRALEERLAKRKQIIDFRNIQDKQAQELGNNSADSYEEEMKKLVIDGNLTEKQKKEILNEYMMDLKRLNRQHEKDSQRQQLDLASKLEQRRLRRIHQLNEKHEQEKSLLLHKTDKSTDTANFIESYHELLQEQRTELESTEAELDQTELQQLDQIRQRINRDKVQSIEERGERMNKAIGSVSSADPADVNRMIKAHKQRMLQLEDARLQEQNRMKAMLQARWEQKMMQLEDDEEKSNQEQETLAEQQLTTVNRVLNSSLELNEEAKKKIMKEHGHNMQVLNNQLQMSKLRQEKSMEAKLAKRRTKIAEIRQKREDELLSKSKMNKDEFDKLTKQLEDELAAEEVKIEMERQQALIDFKRKMASETEALLVEQEKELGVLIGRLEIGAARRQALLTKQDTQLQSLQDQLEKKLTDGTVKTSAVDQILQQHKNQMEYVHDQIENKREHQIQVIQDKIQTKKLMKEQELQEEKHEEREVVKSASIKRRGAGQAASVLKLSYLEQQHKRHRDELDLEMKAELEKSKEALNRELEVTLDTELKQQKKQFLAQLATASDLSKRELEDAVDTAIRDTGGNEQAAKKLGKELRQGLQRAKTDLTLDEDGEIDYIRGRPSSGYQGDTIRPMSGSVIKQKGKKKGKKSQTSVYPREPKESWTHQDYYDSDELL
ncbi:uncharacterized protein LOC143072357 isoform X1 [Mytilus galloprovincialis]|uniref:uncharacterized protein LOC143072357 isoform X1 n=1 Tax=Mytilus galloprovincialis TaxID=29158 RepID=UPI003F7B5734